MSYGSVLTDVVQSSTAGTAPVFKDGNSTQIGTLCRAWVNFNGTGTVAIRGSFNVSSITDSGTGFYTVNFTTAMPDTNYAAMLTVGQGTTHGVDDASRALRVVTNDFSTSSYLIGVVNQSETAFVDANVVQLAVFR